MENQKAMERHVILEGNQSPINLCKLQYGPLVSVITVVFNDEAGILRTIRSVSKQLYPHIEFIIIDGESSDNTVRVAKRFTPYIDKLISEQDTGIYDAMNKGIDAAQGNYIIFMNAGDEFHNNKVLSKVACNLDGKHDVIYGDRSFVRKSGSHRIDKSVSIDEIHKGMCFCHQAAFYKTSTLRSNKFDCSLKYAADYNQTVRLYKTDKTFLKLNETICNFYAGGASQSGIEPYKEVLRIQKQNFSEKEFEESRYLEGFKQEFPELTDDLACLLD